MANYLWPNKAVFLDRDGTLIEAVVGRPEPQFAGKITAPFSMNELKFVPRVGEAIGVLREAGYLIIMITNQPDVANGYVTRETWKAIHQAVLKEVDPDDCFMCRHPSEKKCFFKKPEPGMILAAQDKWGIDLNSSFMIGDTHYDIGAGKAAGCKTVLLSRAYNTNISVLPDFIVPDLISAAYMIASKLY